MPLGLKNETKRYNLLSSWWARDLLAVFQDLDEDLTYQAKKIFNEVNFGDFEISAGLVQAQIIDHESNKIRLELVLEPLSEEELQQSKEFLETSSLSLTEISLGKLPSIFNEDLLEKGKFNTWRS